MNSSVEAWALRRLGLQDFSQLAAKQQQLREEQQRYAARSRFYASYQGGFTTAQQLEADPYAFLCIAPHEVARITTLPTSGTSGKPKRIFFSEFDLQQTIEYFSEGMKELMQPGQQAVIFLPGSSFHSVGDLLEQGVQRLGGSALLYGMIDHWEQAATAARGAHCLAGHPLQLLSLSRLAPQLRPQSLLVTGDHTPAWLLRELEQTWGCRTHPHYGSTESGFGCAVRCQNGPGLQFCYPLLQIEIIDPLTLQPLPAGQWGEIVFSTLQREAMPLLRYRSGDWGRLLPGVWPPRLDEVQYRLHEPALWGWLTIQRLDEAMFRQPQLLHYLAFWREGNLTLQAELLPGAMLSPQQIRQQLYASLGKEFPLTIQLGPVPCQAGKRKFLA